jgi:hypothetical protein
MKRFTSNALAKTSSTETPLSAYDLQPLPVPCDDREPGETFILISRALPYAYLLAITGIGWHLYGGAPGGNGLAAAFILLLAPPGAALFLLPFVPLPGFVLRALRRRRPVPGEPALTRSPQVVLAQAHRRPAPQLPPGPARRPLNP